MSGFEIVGTVLACIPLVLEAFDRSGRVYEMYSVFKQYPRELRIIKDKVGAQQTIFRNNARNLLVAITMDRNVVQEVMQDPSSPVAASLALALAGTDHHQLDSLKDSFTSCFCTAQYIREKLDSLYFQFETFRREVPGGGERNDASEWFRNVSSRFKLGLHKPKINSTIEELRGSNRDFGLIAEQIAKALQVVRGRHNDDSLHNRRSVAGLNVLSKYRRARYASSALYSNLRVQWKCSSHTSHVFDVRILDCEPGDTNGKGKKRARFDSYITCDLAVTHVDSTKSLRSPLRLEVEQVYEVDEDDKASVLHPSHKDAITHQLAAILETSIGKPQAIDAKTAREPISPSRNPFKRIRTESFHSQAVPGPSTVTSQLPTPIPKVKLEDTELEVLSNNPCQDLSVVDDLCQRSWEATSNCMGRSLLGSWTDTRAKLFCVPAEPPSTSQSLSEIITWVAEDPILRSMSRSLLCKLAGDLADGIMQFYSTPWLAFGNLGHHVRYITPEGGSQVISFPYGGPYFMTQLKCTTTCPDITMHTGTGDATSASAATASYGFTEARNQLLFEFGILLLEIGYCKPWSELKQIIMKLPRDSRLSNGISDYEVAERLAQSLINQMGLDYTKIVRKCIGCDFGLGETNLDNEELQQTFVNDVVSGLQKLEQHMKEAERAIAA